MHTTHSIPLSNKLDTTIWAIHVLLTTGCRYIFFYFIYFIYLCSFICFVASKGKALKEEWISYICHEVLNVSFTLIHFSNLIYQVWTKKIISMTVVSNPVVISIQCTAVGQISSVWEATCISNIQNHVSLGIQETLLPAG